MLSKNRGKKREQKITSKIEKKKKKNKNNIECICAIGCDIKAIRTIFIVVAVK